MHIYMEPSCDKDHFISGNVSVQRLTELGANRRRAAMKNPEDPAESNQGNCARAAEGE